MKRLAKFLSAFLVMIFAFSALQVQELAAQPYVELPSNIIVRVEQIIDVNAILVRDQQGQEALVRLIGVSPSSTTGGMNFLQREIAGQYVHLVRDTGPLGLSFETGPGRWNYMYVYYFTRLINAELVLSGYARLNDNHSRALLFDEIRGAQTTAARFGLGLWANEQRHHTLRHHDRINVNMASATQISQHTGAPLALSQAIVNHRNAAVIQQISDLKFVPGMTRDFFEQHSHRLGVSTNINTASEEELATIFTLAQARAIVNSRSLQHLGMFGSVQELVTRGIISQSILNTRVHFLSVDYDYEITFSRPGFRANMNTASLAQLTRAGANHTQANAIIQQRAVMPLRNLQDLSGLAAFPITNHTLNDNMRAFTNINTAPRSEIESLFGTLLAPANLNTTVDSILAERERVGFSDINQFGALLPAGINFGLISPLSMLGRRQSRFWSTLTRPRWPSLWKWV